MPIASVEGLTLTLLLLVPGGFGIELRRWIFPSKHPSPFAELLHALGASAAALIALEIGAAAFRAIMGWPGSMGDALLGPLAGTRGMPTTSDVWFAYLLGFLPLALALPAVAGGLRRARWARTLFGRIALYEVAPDHLFEEVWEAPEKGLSPWVVVETTDGRSIQGEVVWRTMTPNPLELLLVSVHDVTAPDEPKFGGGSVLWIPRENIRRLWLILAEASTT